MKFRFSTIPKKNLGALRRGNIEEGLGQEGVMVWPEDRPLVLL